MGLREGYKDKYYLYTIDGWKMCSVIPLSRRCIQHRQLCRYALSKRIFNGNVTKERGKQQVKT